MVIILLLGNTAHSKSLGDLPQPPMDSGLHFDPSIHVNASDITISSPAPCDTGTSASAVGCDGGGGGTSGVN